SRGRNRRRQSVARGDEAGRAAVVRRPTSDPAGRRLPMPLTSFIGRKRELAELRRRLAATRLLTLTGPGGVGKTRLALEVAAGVAESFAGGVRLVELAPLADPALLPQAIALALGIRDEVGRALVDGIVQHLGARPILLLLDNCEHLVEACAAFVETLLERCPG